MGREAFLDSLEEILMKYADDPSSLSDDERVAAVVMGKDSGSAAVIDQWTEFLVETPARTFSDFMKAVRLDAPAPAVRKTGQGICSRCGKETPFLTADGLCLLCTTRKAVV